MIQSGSEKKFKWQFNYFFQNELGENPHH